MTRYASSHMPPRAPLALQTQDFGVRPEPRASYRASLRDWLWRFGAFAPACLLTLSLIVGLTDWFASGGVTLMETAVIVLVGLTFIWVSLSVSTVTLSLIRRASGATPRRTGGLRVVDANMSVALLIPIYNETPAEVFGNAHAMLKDLAKRPDGPRYSLFILSDTNDPAIGEQEERAYFALRASCPEGVRVHYRRRAENTDKKVGNLSDWIGNWGAAYDAMLVLDADSLMSGAAIGNLAQELANDPDAGLLQSYPVLIGAETLFGRMQQFSSTVYGWLLAEGVAIWSLNEGNYWGHNAIIRTRAFAESAQLPYLRGRGGREDLIFSHDFVEAGLLRRAGWAVRFLPQGGGSYEETPQTLIDYALRDRRWCRGNLQHLRLLTARGFHPLTRFHLLQGAMAFLLSPAWLALILIWSMLGIMKPESTVYFTAANPLTPVWPQASEVSGWVYLAVIYGMLLLPKLAGIAMLSLRPRTRRSYGHVGRFIATAVFEIICSVIFAPIMMVQQSIAVFRALTGQTWTWVPQTRSSAGYGWGFTLWFHKVELVLGAALMVAIWAGYASGWLTLIALSLVLAAPLSRLSALRVDRRVPSVFRLDAPNSLREPRIFKSALSERARMRDLLEQQPEAMAAE
ncbi:MULTISPECIES: glucans biosynthesis glucosyltransferase MdoH [unclassified Roseovarius]|uniref:glucans biosynthesis glucosyltransferase MdoH n=1 Tax=unclassified Roseovarius TaxID=2614913 RepID=UPI00273E3625|nr:MULTISPECIES: glucans biosynthesis glucosyltransferase MdoH [unclassified Roseovarius]